MDRDVAAFTLNGRMLIEACHGRGVPIPDAAIEP